MKNVYDKQKKQPHDIFILGQDERCHVSTNPFETRLNNNILVVGGSGAGKTTGVLLPIMLHMEHSNAVGIFTKWGQIDLVRQVLTKRGYKVHILNFADPDKSPYGFDPLLYCKNDADITDLAHNIVFGGQKDEERKDPFWDTSAENLIKAIIKAPNALGIDEFQCLRHILPFYLDNLVWPGKGVFSSYDDASYDSSGEDIEMSRSKYTAYPIYHMMNMAKKTDPQSFSVWENYVNLPNDTGACITSTTRTWIDKMFTENVRKIICKMRQFDFSEFLKPRTVLLVHLSPVNMDSYRYISVFYRTLFKSLFELSEEGKDRVLPYPVHILCDDFATGCAVPHFADLISLMREKRISVTMLIQSESQLAKIYGHSDATTIINNCDTYIYMGGQDLETSINIGRRTNKPCNEILQLPVGTEYFIRRGQKPFRTKVYNIFNDPVYCRANEILRQR